MPHTRTTSASRTALLGFMATAIIAAITLFTPNAQALDTKDNAALKYWRAFTLLTPDRMKLIGNAKYSITEYGFEFQPGETVHEPDEYLDEVEPIVQMLVEGSRLPGCDFAVDWHLGVEALLPELAPMRNTSLLLLFSAAREVNSGNPDAAAERVAAAIRMSHHVAQDPVLISSLVGLAMFRHATDFAMEGERAGVWTDEGRTAIAQALARFPSNDPFGFIRAMRGEERWVGDWMEARLDNEWKTAEGFAREATDYFMVEIAEIIPAGPNGQVTVVFQGGADGAEDAEEAKAFNALLQADDFRAAMKQEIDLYRLALRMNTEVWNNPEAAQHFDRFEQMLRDGDFGIIATVMLPAFSRAHRQDMETRRALDEIRIMFRAG